MLISNKGTLVRTRTDEISVLGRNAQGHSDEVSAGSMQWSGVEHED